MWYGLWNPEVRIIGSLVRRGCQRNSEKNQLANNIVASWTAPGTLSSIVFVRTVWTDPYTLSLAAWHTSSFATDGARLPRGSSFVVSPSPSAAGKQAQQRSALSRPAWAEPRVVRPIPGMIPNPSKPSQLASPGKSYTAVVGLASFARGKILELEIDGSTHAKSAGTGFLSGTKAAKIIYSSPTIP